jgi:hypothetical protein
MSQDVKVGSRVKVGDRKDCSASIGSVVGIDNAPIYVSEPICEVLFDHSDDDFDRLWVPISWSKLVSEGGQGGGLGDGEGVDV